MSDIRNLKGKRNMSFKSGSKKDKQGRNLILLNHATEIADIPSFVLQNILSRLPLRTILDCKLVRKEWNKLIKDPAFPKLHLSHAAVFPILRAIDPNFWPRDLHLIEATNTNDLVSPSKLHYKILPPLVPLIPTQTRSYMPNRPKFGIVNSCHGLLCVCTTPFNNPIYVCNPITGEYMMLPKPGKDYNTKDYMKGVRMKSVLGVQEFVFSGFGFSPRANKYKVMRILELEKHDKNLTLVQIFTLGSSKWRTLGEIQSWELVGVESIARRPTLLPTEAPYKLSSCVYLDGAVYWLAFSKSATIFINSFNFDNEDFVTILPPAEFCNENIEIDDMRFGLLNDCLYLGDSTNHTQFELWVLKDYKDPSSWTKELVINTLSPNISPRGLYQPIKYLDNGDLLMFHPSNALVCYNLKDQSLRYFKIRGLEWDFEMVPHIPNFISMKDAIKVEDKHVEIFDVRKPEILPDNWFYGEHWVEPNQFLLVEEDADTACATSSQSVE